MDAFFITLTSFYEVYCVTYLNTTSHNIRFIRYRHKCNSKCSKCEYRISFSLLLSASKHKNTGSTLNTHPINLKLPTDIQHNRTDNVQQPDLLASFYRLRDVYKNTSNRRQTGGKTRKIYLFYIFKYTL